MTFRIHVLLPILALVVALVSPAATVAKKAVKAPSKSGGKAKPAVKTAARRAPSKGRVVAKRKSVAPVQPKSELEEMEFGLPFLRNSLLAESMMTPPPVPGSCLQCAQPLLATAYSLIGTRYRLGGNSPQTGFDCSGFTRYVYQTNFDLEMPPSAPMQFRVGTPIAKDELQPGDLVFFRPRGRGWHVGMYVGDNSFIHAPNHRKRVSVSPLNDAYWTKAYVGARRLPLAYVPPAAGIEISSNE